MKTRDRILECALLLFNQRGESNISTLEIATELDMSPGNLYYHFHGKEPLIMELFARFKNELAPLLNPPEQLEVEPEDYALFIHLVVERMAAPMRAQIPPTIWIQLEPAKSWKPMALSHPPPQVQWASIG